MPLAARCFLNTAAKAVDISSFRIHGSLPARIFLNTDNSLDSQRGLCDKRTHAASPAALRKVKRSWFACRHRATKQIKLTL